MIVLELVLKPTTSQRLTKNTFNTVHTRPSQLCARNHTQLSTPRLICITVVTLHECFVPNTSVDFIFTSFAKLLHKWQAWSCQMYSEQNAPDPYQKSDKSARHFKDMRNWTKFHTFWGHPVYTCCLGTKKSHINKNSENDGQMRQHRPPHKTPEAPHRQLKMSNYIIYTRSIKMQQ